MKSIGLFFASETGNTKRVAGLIQSALIEFDTKLIDIAGVHSDIFHSYSFIILGTPTWRKGYLAADWQEFYDDFSKIDFTGKKVALFGLGDQEGYGRTFVNGMGQLATIVRHNNGKIIGEWPTKGYFFDASQADLGTGFFTGLAIDETNDYGLTESRIKEWCAKITFEFEAT